MKIFISDDGDIKSNIPMITATIDINLTYDDYGQESRDYIREKLGEVFKGLFGLHGKMFVMFDKECPNCLVKLDMDRCVNPNCPSNKKDV